MLDIICTIAVAVCQAKQCFLSDASVKGTLKAEQNGNYFIDFNKELVRRGFEPFPDGAVLVNKSRCVKLKGVN